MLMSAHFGGGRPDSLGYIDSEQRPARCHWQNANQEWRCDLVLQAIDDAWTTQVDEAGFDPPMPDDDGLLDIYITSEGTKGGAYTLGPYEDEDLSDGKMGCHAFIAISPNITDMKFPTYIAHEFQHVVQFATDFTEPTSLIWEATATAAEAWTYPDIGYDPTYVWDFQAYPWAGLLADGYMLMGTVGTWTYYEYGAAPWVTHLDAVYGDKAGSGAAQLWSALINDNWNNEPDFLDAYDALTGDWRTALIDFSAQRAKLGTDYAPSWLYNTHESIAIWVDQEIDFDVVPTNLEPTTAPFQTGVTYYRITDIPDDTSLQMSVTSDDDVLWGLVALSLDSDPVWGIDEPITHTPTNSETIVGVINLGEEDFDADDYPDGSDFVLSVEVAVAIEDDVTTENSCGGCSTHNRPHDLLWLYLPMLWVFMRRDQVIKTVVADR